MGGLMFSNSKHAVAYFTLILVTSFLLFNGSYVNNTTQSNSALNPLDTFVLGANPGPSNNGGSPGWAIFFDLIAGPNYNVSVSQMTTGNTASISVSFSVEIFTRTGTALGGPVGSGPGSSTDGWTSIGVANAVQGLTTNGISLLFAIPPISVPAGDTVGVAIKFTGAGPRYYGTGSPPYSVYSDTNITLITGDGRSAPFTPTGSFFTSRALVGEIHYTLETPTGVTNNNSQIPENYKLAQNYPNPFNASTLIEFAVPKNSNVTLKIYNSQGQIVETLVNSKFNAGTYSVRWNAGNLASGVYFYSIKADNFTQTKKLLLVK